jgi:hypothetical protein
MPKQKPDNWEKHIEELGAEIKKVRDQRAKLTESHGRSKRPPLMKNAKKFVSGVKAPLFHPNLDYALAEVAYSPLNQSLSSYRPNSAAAGILNKLRFMGPRHAQEYLKKNPKEKLPCDLERAKNYVIKKVMTYHPPSGHPAVKRKPPRTGTAKTGERPETSGGMDTAGSMASSHRLASGDMDRPRSSRYLAAVARGGPKEFISNMKKDNEQKTLSRITGDFGFMMGERDDRPSAMRDFNYDPTRWKPQLGVISNMTFSTEVTEMQKHSIPAKSSSSSSSSSSSLRMSNNVSQGVVDIDKCDVNDMGSIEAPPLKAKSNWPNEMKTVTDDVIGNDNEYEEEFEDDALGDTDLGNAAITNVRDESKS